MIIINGQEDIENFDISSIQNVEELKIINVPKIPEGKFHGLNKLNKVYMNNINIIESGAFMDCKNLKDISFKNNPKEIHDFAFHNTKIGFIPELYKDTKFGVYNNLGKNITLENTSWSNINKLSNLSKCKDYFNIGDMKSMTLTNGETYNAEIIGFDHDDLADGSGKAGITFQFKELMITRHNMNSATYEYQYGYNIGGWKASEMRDYVNNDVYALLPADLQIEIKEVSKVSDVGNKNITDLMTTNDKLFLLSFKEVGFTSSNSSYFASGQGTQYEKFIDNASRVKYLSGSAAGWWLRSTSIASYFFNVGSDGGYYITYANYTYGVAPAFCI